MGKEQTKRKRIHYSIQRKLKKAISLMLTLALCANVGMTLEQPKEVAAEAAVSDKAWFTNFEETAYSESDKGNRIVQDSPYVSEGRQALKYARNGSAGVWGVTVKSVTGSAIDISAMTKIVVNIYDTQGNNTFALKLTDTTGTNREIMTSQAATQNTWTSIEVPLTEFNTIDLSSLDKVDIFEMNDGDYYIDNIYFADEGGNQIVYQNFENCLYYNNDWCNSIVSSVKRSGNFSLRYTQGWDVVIEAADKNGVDATDKSNLVFWIKDTNGNNDFELLLTDVNGNTSKANYRTSNRSVKNEWVGIVVPMAELLDSSNLDVSKITKVKIWASNSGDYYLDDIYFCNSVPPTAPSANYVEGIYTEAFDLTLTTSETDAAIFYTTDQSTPTENSTPYTEPISISDTTTVKAVVIKDGDSSSVLTLNYRIIAEDLPDRSYLQDFEGSPVVKNGQIVSDQVFSGDKAALYSVATAGYPSVDNSFFVENAEPVNASNYNYLVFMLKDTQGSNNLIVQLLDSDGHTSEMSWYNTLTTSNKMSVKNSWTEYAIDLNDINGIANIDRSKITGIRIGEWNSGSYYLDDIYFTNTLLPSTPTASYNSGTYGEIKNLTLATSAEGCNIYYTTDGSIPTETSNVYSGAITLTGNTTIKAVAISTSNNKSSLVATFTYKIQPLPESGLVAFNTFDSSIDKVSETTGANISLNTEEKYNGASGLTYQVATLSGSPSKNARSITIRPESGSSIDARLSKYLVFYVKDMQGCNNTYMYIKDELGNEATGWTSCSTVYGQWSQYYVELGALEGYSKLDQAYLNEVTFGFYNQGTYYIDEVYLTDQLYTGLPGGSGTVLEPTEGEVLSSVTPGSYTVFKAVELAVEDGATIYYTVDGTTPTTGSILYNKAIYITDTTTIKAISVKNDNASEIFEFNYVIKPAPVFAIYGKPGNYNDSVVVALRSTKDDTPIYYTVDGSTPDNHSIRYISAFRIEENTTLKAIAYTGTKELDYLDGEASEVSSLAYVINGTENSINSPKVSVSEGTYGAPITIALTTKTEGATIYYTTNGEEPSITSTLYTGSINISSTKTIKAIAVKNDAISDITTYNYIINTGASNFLKADGKMIKNNYGTGDEVLLRGTNVGGWLITESWMCPLDAIDQVTTIDVFTERFGEETAIELIDYYQDRWWTETDFDRVKAEGLNLLRLPISYMGMLNEDGTLKESAFERIDWFIQEAKERDIYVLIDMHGAVGSQNGKDHSGDAAIPDIGNFFGNEMNIQKTIYLWEKIAERYKNEPMVCGYDILNEPAATGMNQFEVYDRLYDAIRAIDKNHMIYIEAVWNPADLPSPSLYGWENIVYEYHFYPSSSDKNVQVNFINDKIGKVQDTNYNVPVYVGEFSFSADTEAWDSCLALFESQGWSWTTWTYKVTHGNESSWGLYSGEPDKVFVNIDSEEVIKDKWSKITTDTNFVRCSRYADVLKTYYDKNQLVKVPYGTTPPPTVETTTPPPTVEPTTPPPTQGPVTPPTENGPTTTPSMTPTPSPTPEIMEDTINMLGINGDIILSIEKDEENKKVKVDVNLPVNEIMDHLNETTYRLNLTIPIASDNIVELIGDGKTNVINLVVNIPSSISDNNKINISEITLDQKILDAAQNSNQTVTVSVQDENGKEQYSWTFNGNDLANSDKTITKVNLSLTAENINSNSEVAGLLNKDNLDQSLVINFNHHGILPAQAKVKINVGDLGLKQGENVYLYYYNVQSGKLETLPRSSYKVDKDGYITLNILHCSEYVVLYDIAPNDSITSLREQIQISPKSKTLLLNSKTKNSVSIKIKLPTTLELVSSLQEKTSSSAVGAVTVTYSSGNKKVVTVDKNGKVTAKRKGIAWITTKITLYNGKVKNFTTKIVVK